MRVGMLPWDKLKPDASGSPMSIIYRAHIDSRHFAFEAYALHEAAALESMVSALENHGRQYELSAQWWDGHCDLEIHGFEIGRGYRDGSELDAAPGVGEQGLEDDVFRATMQTEHFSFEAYGRTLASAKSALIEVLKAHGLQNGLKASWWRMHYDLEINEFKLGVGYRDRSPMPVFEPVSAEAPANPSI